MRTERRTFAARVMRFREGVYASRGTISTGCQVLLLRMSDDMSPTCIVSTPQSELADDLGCPQPRVSEWTKQARDAGFLSVVKPAKRGRTAVYQGLVVKPNGIRPAVTQSDEWDTPSVIPSPYAQPYANTPEWHTPSTPPTEVVRPARIDRNPFEYVEDEDAFEEPSCEVHELGYCPRSCDNHPANSRRTA